MTTFEGDDIGGPGLQRDSIDNRSAITMNTADFSQGNQGQGGRKTPGGGATSPTRSIQMTGGGGGVLPVEFEGSLECASALYDAYAVAMGFILDDCNGGHPETSTEYFTTSLRVIEEISNKVLKKIAEVTGPTSLLTAHTLETASESFYRCLQLMLSRATTDGTIPSSGYADWLITQLNTSINWGSQAVEVLKLHTSRLSAQDMHYVLSLTLPYRPPSTDTTLATNAVDPKAAAGKGAKPPVAAVPPPKGKAPAAKAPGLEAAESPVDVPPPEAINIPLSTSLQRLRARIQCRLIRQKYHLGVLKNHHLSINGELSPGDECY